MLCDLSRMEVLLFANCYGTQKQAIHILQDRWSDARCIPSYPALSEFPDVHLHHPDRGTGSTDPSKHYFPAPGLLP
jgi:hypothetical protein